MDMSLDYMNLKQDPKITKQFLPDCNTSLIVERIIFSQRMTRVQKSNLH